MSDEIPIQAWYLFVQVRVAIIHQSPTNEDGFHSVGRADRVGLYGSIISDIDVPIIALDQVLVASLKLFQKAGSESANSSSYESASSPLYIV